MLAPKAPVLMSPKNGVDLGCGRRALGPPKVCIDPDAADAPESMQRARFCRTSRRLGIAVAAEYVQLRLPVRSGLFEAYPSDRSFSAKPIVSSVVEMRWKASSCLHCSSWSSGRMALQKAPSTSACCTWVYSRDVARRANSISSASESFIHSFQCGDLLGRQPVRDMRIARQATAW
jgi:hypothetical protein